MLSSLFSSISSSPSNKLPLLQDIQTAMGSLSRADLEQAVNSLDLQVLFNCLDTDNLEEIGSTCEILKTLMSILDPLVCLERYHQAVVLGFEHTDPRVPALVMDLILHSIHSSPTILDKEPFPLLRQAILHQLTSEELQTAKVADNLLLKYSQTPPGSTFFLSDQFLQTFANLLKDPKTNSTKKFRIYETATNIATISPQHLSRLNQKLGLMDGLIKLSFKSDDVLGQINAVEILANLVGCEHGQEALRKEGVFDEVKKMSLDGGMMKELLLPGLVKFVGKVGVVCLPPEDLVELVIRNLLDNRNDYAMKTVATEAFAHIGSTLEGKRYYGRMSNTKQCLESIRDLIFQAPTDYRVRGLEAMAFLFGSDESNEDCLPYWFNILFHDISELFELVRLPFPEMRLAALHFLCAIAHLEWAQRHYLRGAGVIEFLTSRAPEPEKECVYAKYRLVKIIVNSPSVTSKKILSPEDLARLKVYVNQGPFYAPSESTVATEGAGS